MLYHCYRSYLPLQEGDALSLAVQRAGGWMHIRSLDCVDYLVPETRSSLVYLYDSRAERIPKLDYIQ